MTEVIGHDLLERNCKETLNVIRALYSLPVCHFFLRIYVFRTLAPRGLNISRCSDSSYFEQTAAIIIDPMAGIPTPWPNHVPHKYPLLAVAGTNSCMSFYFSDVKILSTYWSCFAHFSKTSDTEQTAGNIIDCILICR